MVISCDFDSFQTRKDWYLTWRQMRTLVDSGFELGNHTKGHVGGADLRPFLEMDDELLAHHLPQTTTLAWPVYQANPAAYHDLAAHGFTFGRGGHFRAYRPTVDSPFDVPSFWCSDIETFVRCVRKATGGKIVVITFHGVPDGEHPSVGIEPSTFREMMRYLKANRYHAIALRDLAEYIDPAKAAQLPPTADNVREVGPVLSIQDDRPFAAADIQTFAFPGLPPVTLVQRVISVTVPYATDVTALAPTIAVSAGIRSRPRLYPPADLQGHRLGRLLAGLYRAGGEGRPAHLF